MTETDRWGWGRGRRRGESKKERGMFEEGLFFTAAASK